MGAEPSSTEPPQVRLAAVAGRLTAAERRIADHVTSREPEARYASAAQVARELGLAASTVVRFAQRLGYPGWRALQDALRREARDRQLVGMAPADAGFLAEHVEAEVRNLRFLAQQAPELDAAARLLATAPRVWTGGDRASAFVAAMGRHFLRMVRPDVQPLDTDAAAVPDALLDVAPEDAVWLVGMSRYSRRTLAVARYLSGRVPIVLLTDERTSPLLPLATVRLRFASESATSLRSDTAAYATAQALVLAVARHVPGARDRLARAEALWDEFDVFAKEA